LLRRGADGRRVRHGSEWSTGKEAEEATPHKIMLQISREKYGGWENEDRSKGAQGEASVPAFSFCDLLSVTCVRASAAPWTVASLSGFTGASAESDILLQVSLSFRLPRCAPPGTDTCLVQCRLV
jgi:hypothetical protein